MISEHFKNRGAILTTEVVMTMSRTRKKITHPMPQFRIRNSRILLSENGE
jgi:hypothetical protein